MDKVAIFGAAGPIGRYVGMELDRRGVPFRAVGRTASKLAEAFGKLPHAEVVAADLSDAGGAMQAARGVDTIVYAVGVAYTEFQLHPKMKRVAVDAAAAAGVQRWLFFFSGRRRHTRLQGDWSSDVCSSDLQKLLASDIDIGSEQLLVGFEARE